MSPIKSWNAELHPDKTIKVKPRDIYTWSANAADFMWRVEEIIKASSPKEHEYLVRMLAEWHGTTRVEVIEAMSRKTLDNPTVIS